MTLITLILVLALIGFLLWTVVTYIPMPEPWKRAVVVIAVIALVLWLLQFLGVVGPTVPRIR